MKSYIKVRVNPRAQRTEIYEILPDGTYKIRIKETPIKGKANKALVKYLSKVLKIPRSRIRIVSGDKSREKLISFQEIEKEQLEIYLSNAFKNNADILEKNG